MGKFSNNIIASKFGDLKSNINLSASHFKKRRSATTTGTITEIIKVSLLYNFILSEFILLT